jgi:hypothetical protein
MGYRLCYKRYMALLGYDVRSLATGAFIVEGDDGKAVDPGEYLTYYTYYIKWNRDFPNLKVSWLVEDICLYCYPFANRHRYLANCSGSCGNDGDNKGGGDVNGLGPGKDEGNKGNADCNGNKDIANLASHGMTSIYLNPQSRR